MCREKLRLGMGVVLVEHKEQTQGVAVCKFVFVNLRFIREVCQSGAEHVVPHALQQVAAICDKLILKIVLSEGDTL